MVYGHHINNTRSYFLFVNLWVKVHFLSAFLHCQHRYVALRYESIMIHVNNSFTYCSYDIKCLFHTTWVFSPVLSETTEEFFLPCVIILLSQHVGVNFNHNNNLQILRTRFSILGTRIGSLIHLKKNLAFCYATRRRFLMFTSKSGKNLKYSSIFFSRDKFCLWWPTED